MGAPRKPRAKLTRDALATRLSFPCNSLAAASLSLAWCMADDALEQVAQHFTATLDLDLAPSQQASSEDEQRAAVVAALMFVHSAVGEACERARRQGEQLLFITPRHYVDFLQQASARSACEGAKGGRQTPRRGK